MSYPSRGGVAVLDMKDDHLEMGVTPSAGGRGGNRGNGKPEGLPSSFNANNDDATEDSLAEEAAGRAAEPVGIVPAEKDGEEEPMILRSPEQEMWYYVGLGDKERVRQLVAQGADVNASDLNPQVDSVQERQTQNEYEAWERTETLYPKLTGNYALHIAADHDNVEMISFLFYLGAKMENRNRIGSTALHRAAAKGHCDAVEELVKLGADVHARNKIGNTALHIAAIIGHLPMLKLLIKLDAGKGLRAPNKVAMTPIEYTQRQSAERAYLLSIDPSLREFLNESEDGDEAASTTTAGTASMVDDEKRDA